MPAKIAIRAGNCVKEGLSYAKFWIDEWNRAVNIIESISLPDKIVSLYQRSFMDMDANGGCFLYRKYEISGFQTNGARRHSL
jgi:hypothetical protein